MFNMNQIYKGISPMHRIIKFSTVLLIGILFFQGYADADSGQFPGYYSPRDSVWVFTMDSVFVQGVRAPQLSPHSTVSVQEERIEAMGYRDLNEVVSGEISGVFGNEKGVMGYGVAG